MRRDGSGYIASRGRLMTQQERSEEAQNARVAASVKALYLLMRTGNVDVAAALGLLPESASISEWRDHIGH